MKRILSLFLAALLCVSLLPFGVLADGEIAEEAPAEDVVEEIVPASEPESESIPEPEPIAEPEPEPEPVEVTTEKPITDAEEAPVLDGIALADKAGPDLTWSLSSSGVLTISGTGHMYQFYYEASAPPWYLKWNSVTSIVIEEGVTIIGDYAFRRFNNLKSVTLPDSLKIIRLSAFESCESLTEITIPAGVTSIEGSVFEDCSSLESIYFLGSAPSIDDTAFKDITATAYYPTGNASWTNAVKQNYGGTITWKPLTEAWVKLPGGYRYRLSNGSYAKDRFIDIDGKTYYIDPSGYLYLGTNWQKIGGSYYYFKSGVRATGLQYISGSYYFFNADGTIYAGWMKYGGAMYFYDNDARVSKYGKLVTGLKEFTTGLYDCHNGTSIDLLITEGGWYYFDTSTAKMYTGILKYDGSYYLYKENGVLYAGWLDYDGARYYYDTTTYKLAVGWKQIEGGTYIVLSGSTVSKLTLDTGWYYFRPSTAQMATGWLYYNGKYYYLDDTTGRMYADGTYSFDGKAYTFNENGVYIG